MKQDCAHLKTNELVESVNAFWDSPEDLLVIRQELLRRRTRGAARLRMTVEARVADFGDGEPSAGTLEGSNDGTASDEAALKRQISDMTLEIMELRKMASLKGANAYLYARVGAHEGIADFALEALREAHRNKFRPGGKVDESREASEILFRIHEEIFDQIALLRSGHR